MQTNDASVLPGEDRWVAVAGGAQQAPASACGDGCAAPEPADGALEGVLQGISALHDALALVPDPRAKRGVRHGLTNVLTIAVLGAICGCNDAEALEDWSRKERDWLSQFMALPHGTPSQDVFLRVFAGMDPEPFRNAFRGWVDRLLSAFASPGQIAIDGQTHRGSVDRANGTKALHTVNALGCDNGMVLGQQPTDKKSNEIKAVPLLLELLYIKGALVSLDAMGCQVKIAKQIVERGGDYLLGLKGNQSTLHQETRQFFETMRDPAPRPLDQGPLPVVERWTHCDAGHGRLEQRTAFVCHDFAEWVPAGQKWPSLATLICVESTREDAISGASSCEKRYYVSSRKLDAAAALRAVRAHWAVENSLHHVLDVTFDQDANRTRVKNAATNLNIVRNFAINAIRAYTGDTRSMPRRRRLCDYDVAYRMKVMAAIAGP